MAMESGGEIDLRIDREDGTCVIYASGELSIGTAGRLRSELAECAETGTNAVLDAAGITAIDLCGLQLLCSAHRTWRLKDASFRLRNASAAIRETACAAGFEFERTDCPYRHKGDCLWRHQGNP